MFRVSSVFTWLIRFARLHASQGFFRVACTFAFMVVMLANGKQIHSYIHTALAGIWPWA